jgi:hypothetical protein
MKRYAIEYIANPVVIPFSCFQYHVFLAVTNGLEVRRVEKVNAIG